MNESQIQIYNSNYGQAEIEVKLGSDERFNVFISLIFHYNTLKCFLRKEFNELSKNIFSAVHNLIFLLFSKVKIQIVDMHFLLYFASIPAVTRVK